MSEKNEKRFLFNINSTNELTEEIYTFSSDNNTKPTILFILAIIILSFTTAYLAFQFGALLNVDTTTMTDIYNELKQTDTEYTEEYATHKTLVSENEQLTQDLLTKQSETGQLNDYSMNKDTLAKKLDEVKDKHEKLKTSIEERKTQIEQSGESVYNLTLNPGVYIVGKNIPAATFDVTGNGSIIASSSSNETKINEKLAKDTAITLHFLDGYTVKITSITKFVLKE